MKSLKTSILLIGFLFVFSQAWVKVKITCQLCHIPCGVGNGNCFVVTGKGLSR